MRILIERRVWKESSRCFYCSFFRSSSSLPSSSTSLISSSSPPKFKETTKPLAERSLNGNSSGIIAIICSETIYTFSSSSPPLHLPFSSTQHSISPLHPLVNLSTFVCVTVGYGADIGRQVKAEGWTLPLLCICCVSNGWQYALWGGVGDGDSRVGGRWRAAGRRRGDSN